MHVLRTLVILSIGIAALAFQSVGVTQAATLQVCKSGCPFSTIQAAINAASNGDTIDIGPDSGGATYIENVTIDRSVTLIGVGKGEVINGGGNGSTVTVNGTDAQGHQVVTTISNLTITGGGNTNYGGGINVVYTTATLPNITITDSTIDGNLAILYGGGINGPVTLVNSTVYDNAAGYYGGGMLSSPDPSTLLNDTIVGNTVGQQYAGLDGAFTLDNSIVSGNHTVSGPSNCFANVTSNGHNILGDASGCNGLTSTDLVGVDPQLGPLQDNGGPTPTMALPTTSPAVDAGDDAICSGAQVGNVDQRGLPRNHGSHCDIGAYELQSWWVAPGGSDSASCISAATACQHVSHAIANAASGDAVLVNGGTYNETEVVAKNLALVGTDGATINGGGSRSVITINGPYIVSITGLTIEGGGADNGAGIDNDTGTVTLTRSTVTNNDNSASSYFGGGIWNLNGTMTIVQSAITNNKTNLQGGAIFNDGTLYVYNSTISGNSAARAGAFNGGAIYNETGTSTLINDTIANNTAGGYVGGIYNAGDNGASVSLSNTILAANTANNGDPDCAGALTSNDYNILGNRSANCTITTQSHDLVNVNPGLAALGNNGSLTATMALSSASPALDAGNDAVCSAAPINGVDQRGYPRPDGAHCDIGAYEFEGALYVATGGSDGNACTTAASPCQSVEKAVGLASPGASVHVAGGIFNGDVHVDHSVTIDGAGACCTTLMGTGTGPVITVTARDANGSAVTAALSHLRISGGGGAAGGGVLNAGALTITDTAIRDNHLTGTPGDANGSTCAGTFAGSADGGGIMNNGTLTLVRSTVSNNSLIGGNGVGGGLFNNSSAGATLINSTIADNTATGGGSDVSGGAGNGQGGGIMNYGNLTLMGSTIAANAAAGGSDPGGSAQALGGGIFSYGTTNLTNTILAANSAATQYPDCAGFFADGTMSNGSGGSTPAGNNIVGDWNGSCTGLTNGTNGDRLGSDTQPLDPLLDPRGPVDNGGGVPTIALQWNSAAIGAGNATACAAAPVADVDGRNLARHTTARTTCDIGAYDTGGAISLSKGWNLIDLQLQDASTSTVSGLVGNIRTQLGSGVVSAIATYGSGRFNLYVPGYSTDQPLPSGQGIVVLSTKTGAWMPPGSAPTTAPSINLQPGWNLVGAPIPAAGLNGTSLDTELGGACGFQEAAAYGGGSYLTYLAGSGTSFHVPSTAGLWIECTTGTTWTPT